MMIVNPARCALLCTLAALFGAPAHAEILTTFDATSSAGFGLQSGVVMDKTGALYGTTNRGASFGAGGVYQLVPPATPGAAWTQITLYVFGSASGDGSGPLGDLLMDKSGALYGTTRSGGGPSYSGTIYKLTPPAAGGSAWTETILYSFDRNDGADPFAGLIEDSAGALYGTTENGGTLGSGTVFKLSPPTGPRQPWTLQTLCNFGEGSVGYAPQSKLLMDSAGNLYGTTTGGGGSGTIFELSPPAAGQTAWAATVLYAFPKLTTGREPLAGVVMDQAGNLYGTTYNGGQSTNCYRNCGVVFQLAPPVTPGAAWTETVLHSFTGAPDGDYPYSAVALDSKGNLYGTTASGGPVSVGCTLGCGTLFQLKRPAGGVGTWIETVMAPPAPGADPTTDLLLGKDGYIYGTTLGSTETSSAGGIVFRLPSRGARPAAVRPPNVP